MSRKYVYEWFKSFRERMVTTEDKPRSGRPSTSRTPKMIEKVRQMLAKDGLLTLRLIAEELGISKDMAHTIVRDDLGKWKICSRFVPHKFIDKPKAKQMETSGDFISMCDQNPLLLENNSWEIGSCAISSIRNQNSNRWCGVYRLPRDKKKKKTVSSAKLQRQNTADRLLRQQGHHP